MFFSKSDETSKSLSTLIRRQITDRILVAFGLLVMLLVLLTRSELHIWSSQVTGQVAQSCEKLEDYVISQVLLHNDEAVRAEIQQFNDENPNQHLIWLKGSETPTDGGLRWRFPFSWMFNYNLRAVGAQQFGAFEVQGSILTDKKIFAELILRTTLLVIFSTLIMLTLLPLSRRVPNLLIFQPIRNILYSLRAKKSAGTDSEIESTLEFKTIRQEIEALLKEARDASRSKAVAEIASLVAHDIRSPLAALQAMEQELRALPEQTRVLLRKSIGRIKDIAENLLEAYGGKLRPQSISGYSFKKASHPATHLATAIEDVVWEVRKRFESINASIEWDKSPTLMSAFLPFERSEFQRVISNLIVNGVEALKESKGGCVRISAEPIDQGHVRVLVRDNGCGIESESLKKLGAPGVTFGKTNGVGLGFCSAKRSVERWNGQITVDSRAGEGTTVQMVLPTCEPPAWFFKELHIDGITEILVLDDDEMVHQLWDQRFENFCQKTVVRHFTSIHSFADCVAKNRNAESSFLCLVDFDLRDEMTGIDVIEKLQISRQSVLVTSQSDDPVLQARCLDIGIKLLPKSLAAFVPIVAAPVLNALDLALIDDDELIRMSWRNRALDKNKKIAIFETLEEFLKQRIALDIPVYVDLHLGGKSGFEVAKRLSEQGYENIKIATGGTDIKNMPPYVNDVCGKDFPLS